MDVSSVANITRIFRSSGNGHRFFYFVNGRLKTFATLKDDINQQIAELFGALNGTFLTRTAVALAVTALPLLLQSAYALDSNALPTGYQSVDGSHTFDQNGNVLNINTNANNSIVNYSTFDIGSNATVNMNLPNAQAAILNRVLGGNLSEIFGTLNSNGQVFLINPAGIVFGNTATINVSGLVASTLNISNENFMNGHFEFSRVDGSAPASINILNGAQINVANGGSANFLSSAFSNAGNVNAPGGHINIAIGDRVNLTNDLIGLTVNEALQDRIQGIAAVANSGNLSAESIKILASTLKEGVLDTIVNNTGRIRANKVVDGAGGTIELIADNGIVANGIDGILDASGTDGGYVLLSSEATLNQGEILATGSTGQGGTVNLLGDKVALTGNALVDASGVTGGGNINVGGGFQGADPSLRNSQRTYVTGDVQLKADAIESGNGGQVVVWSDGDTLFEGSIEAKGGAQSGNGGNVEVSGKENLLFNGLVDTSAVVGETGNLLLDPRDLTIVDGGNTGTLLSAVDAFSDSPGVDMTVNDGRINASATNVTLRANRDMTFASNVDINLTGAKTFTAEAGRDMTTSSTSTITASSVTLTSGRDMTLSGDITSNGGDITLTAGQTFAGIGGSGAQGDLNVLTSATLTSNGGAVNIESKADDVSIDGDILSSGGAVNIVAKDDVSITTSGDVDSGAGIMTLNADKDASGNGDLFIDGELDANGSTINLIGTTLQIDTSGDVNAGVAGIVNIRPSDVKNVTVFTNDSDGNNDTGATMDVSTQELDRITAGTVNIGSTTPGAMNDIVISNATAANLNSLGYNINLLAARDITGGNQNVSLGAKTLNLTAGRDIDLANMNRFTNGAAGRDVTVANTTTGLTFNDVTANTGDVSLTTTGNNRAITGNDVTAMAGSVTVSTTGLASAVTLLGNVSAAASGINLSTNTSLAVVGDIVTPGTLSISTGSGSATKDGTSTGASLTGDVLGLVVNSTGGTVKFADRDGLILNGGNVGATGTLDVTAGTGVGTSNGAAESNLMLAGNTTAGTLNITTNGANNIQQQAGSTIQGSTLNATGTGFGQGIFITNADFNTVNLATSNGNASYSDRDGATVNMQLGGGATASINAGIAGVTSNNSNVETNLTLTGANNAAAINLFTNGAHNIQQTAGSTIRGTVLAATTTGAGQTINITDADFGTVNLATNNGNLTYVDRDGVTAALTNAGTGTASITVGGVGVLSNNFLNELHLSLGGANTAATFNLTANGFHNIQQDAGSSIQGTTLNATNTGLNDNITLTNADFNTVNLSTNDGNAVYVDRDGFNATVQSKVASLTAGGSGTTASNGAAESNLTLTGASNSADSLTLLGNGFHNIQQAGGSTVTGGSLSATTNSGGQTITLTDADFASVALTTNNGAATYRDRDGFGATVNVGTATANLTAGQAGVVSNNALAESSLNFKLNSTADTLNVTANGTNNITQTAGSTVQGDTLNATTTGAGQSITLDNADFDIATLATNNGNATYTDRDGVSVNVQAGTGTANLKVGDVAVTANNAVGSTGLNLMGNNNASTFNLNADGSHPITQLAGSTVQGTTLNATATGNISTITLNNADFTNVNLSTHDGTITYKDADGFTANVNSGYATTNLTAGDAGVTSNNGVVDSGLILTGSNEAGTLNLTANAQNVSQAVASSIKGTNLTVNTTTGNSNLGSVGAIDFATYTLNTTGAGTHTYADLDGYKATVNAPTASVTLRAGVSGVDINGNPLAPAIPETGLILGNISANNLTITLENGQTLTAEAGTNLTGRRLDVSAGTGNVTLGLAQNLDFAEYTVSSTGSGNTITLNDTDGFDLLGMSAAGSTVNLTSATSGTPVNLNGNPVAGNTESGIRFVSGNNTAGTLNLTANGGQGISQTGGTIQGTNLNATTNGAGSIVITDADFDNVSLNSTGGTNIVYQDKDGFNVNASAPTAGSSIFLRAGAPGLASNNGVASTDLNVTGSGIVGGSTAILKNTVGDININSKIQLSGSVTELDAAGSINQSLLAGAEITSSHLVARSGAGSISLNNLGNTVTNFAAQALTAGQDIGFISNVGFAISNVVGPTITVNGVQAADRVIIRSTTGNISQDAGTLFFGNDLDATTVGAARTITIGDADFNSVRFTTNNGNASYADLDGFSGSGAVGTGTLSLTAAQAGLLSTNSNAETHLTLTENTTGATVNLIANGANNIQQAPASTVQGTTLNATTTGAGQGINLSNADFNTANLATNNGIAIYGDRDGVKLNVQAGAGSTILTVGTGGTANNATAETDLTFIGANNASSIVTIANGANNIQQAVGSTVTGSGLNAVTTGTGIINLTDADFASVFLTTSNTNATYRDRDGVNVSANVGTGTASITAAQAGVVSNNSIAESNLTLTGNNTAGTLNLTANGANNIQQAAGSTVQGTQLLATTTGAGQTITLTDADFADVRLTTNNGNATYADRDGFIAISTTAGTGTVNLTAGAAGVLSNNGAAETHMQFGGINTAQTFNLVSNGVHTIDQTGPSRIQGSTVNATVNGAGLTLRLGNADFTNANLTTNNSNVIYRDADGVIANVQAGLGIAEVQVATAGSTANNGVAESNLVLTGNNSAATFNLITNGANSISQAGGSTVQGSALNATTNGVGGITLTDADFATANFSTANGNLIYTDRDGVTANVSVGGTANVTVAGAGVVSNNAGTESSLTLTGANVASVMTLTANGANNIQQSVGSTIRGTTAAGTLNATTTGSGTINITDADFVNVNLATNNTNATYQDRDGFTANVNVGTGTANLTAAQAGVASNNGLAETNLTMTGNNTAGTLNLTANGANSIQQNAGSTVQGTNLNATTNGLLRTITLADADFTNVNLTTNNGGVTYRDRDGFNATVNSGIGTANLTAAQAGVTSNNGVAEANLVMTGSSSANTLNLTANGATNITQAGGSTVQGNNLNATTNGAGASIALTDADFNDVTLATNNGNATYTDRDGFTFNANAGTGTVNATAAGAGVLSNNGSAEGDLTFTGNSTADTFNLFANGSNNINQGLLSTVQGVTVNATTTGAGSTINLTNVDFTNATLATNNGNSQYRDRDGVNLNFNLGTGTMDAAVQPIIPVTANNGVVENNLNLIGSSLAATVNLTTNGSHSITQSVGSTVRGTNLNTNNLLGTGSTILTDADFTNVNALSTAGNITYVDRDGFNLTATALGGTVNATAAGAGVASNNGNAEANLNFVGNSRAVTFNVTANGTNNITEDAAATIAGTNLTATTTGAGQTIGLNDADFNTVTLATNNGNATYRDRDGFNVNVNVGTGTANLTEASNAVVSSNNLAGESTLTFFGNNTAQTLNVTTTDNVNINQAAGSTIAGTNLNTQTLNSGASTTLTDTDFAVVTASANNNNVTIVDRDGAQLTANAGTGTVSFTAGGAGVVSNNGAVEANLTIANANAAQTFNLTATGGIGIQQLAGSTINGTNLNVVIANGNTNIGNLGNADFANVTFNATGAGVQQYTDLDGFEVAGSVANGTLTLLGGKTGTDTNGNPLAPANPENNIILGNLTAKTLNLTSQNGIGIVIKPGATVTGTTMNLTTNASVNLGNTPGDKLDFAEYSVTSAGVGNTIAVGDTDGFDILGINAPNSTISLTSSVSGTSTDFNGNPLSGLGNTEADMRLATAADKTAQTLNLTARDTDRVLQVSTNKVIANRLNVVTNGGDSTITNNLNQVSNYTVNAPSGTHRLNNDVNLNILASNSGTGDIIVNNDGTVNVTQLVQGDDITINTTNTNSTVTIQANITGTGNVSVNTANSGARIIQQGGTTVSGNTVGYNTAGTNANIEVNNGATASGTIGVLLNTTGNNADVLLDGNLTSSAGSVLVNTTNTNAGITQAGSSVVNAATTAAYRTTGGTANIQLSGKTTSGTASLVQTTGNNSDIRLTSTSDIDAGTTATVSTTNNSADIRQDSGSTVTSVGLASIVTTGINADINVNGRVESTGAGVNVTTTGLGADITQAAAGAGTDGIFANGQAQVTTSGLDSDISLAGKVNSSVANVRVATSGLDSDIRLTGTSNLNAATTADVTTSGLDADIRQDSGSQVVAGTNATLSTSGFTADIAVNGRVESLGGNTTVRTTGFNSDITQNAGVDPLDGLFASNNVNVQTTDSFSDITLNGKSEAGSDINVTTTGFDANISINGSARLKSLDDVTISTTGAGSDITTASGSSVIAEEDIQVKTTGFDADISLNGRLQATDPAGAVTVSTTGLDSDINQNSPTAADEVIATNAVTYSTTGNQSGITLNGKSTSTSDSVTASTTGTNADILLTGNSDVQAKNAAVFSTTGNTSDITQQAGSKVAGANAVTIVTTGTNADVFLAGQIDSSAGSVVVVTTGNNSDVAQVDGSVITAEQQVTVVTTGNDLAINIDGDMTGNQAGIAIISAGASNAPVTLGANSTLAGTNPTADIVVLTVGDGSTITQVAGGSATTGRNLTYLTAGPNAGITLGGNSVAGNSLLVNTTGTNSGILLQSTSSLEATVGDLGLLTFGANSGITQEAGSTALAGNDLLGATLGDDAPITLDGANTAGRDVVIGTTGLNSSLNQGATGTINAGRDIMLDTFGSDNAPINLAGSSTAGRDAVIETQGTNSSITMTAGSSLVAANNALLQTNGANSNLTLGGLVSVNNRLDAQTLTSSGQINLLASGALFANNGIINLKSNQQELSGIVSAGLASGVIQISAFDPGTTIGLGGGAGVLNLSQAEFNNMFARDIIIGDQTTNSLMTIGLVDLSGKTSTDLTLNTLFSIQESTPTEDASGPNIIMANDRNVFFTGGATGVADRLTSTGVQFVGNQDSIFGDIDVQLPGAGLAFVKLPGSPFFSGKSIRVITPFGSAFVNVPDDDSSRSLRNLAGSLNARAASLIINQFNNTTIQLPGSVNLIPSTFGGFGSANAPIVPFKAF